MIVSPPLADPYHVIKDKLPSIYDTSEDENLNQLLHGVCLGDRLPSDLLSHMQRLGGSNVGTGLLKKLFLERLPPIGLFSATSQYPLFGSKQIYT